MQPLDHHIGVAHADNSNVIGGNVVALLALLLPMPLLANERLATKDSYGRIYSKYRWMGG